MVTCGLPDGMGGGMFGFGGHTGYGRVAPFATYVPVGEGCCLGTSSIIRGLLNWDGVG